VQNASCLTLCQGDETKNECRVYLKTKNREECQWLWGGVKIQRGQKRLPGIKGWCLKGPLFIERILRGGEESTGRSLGSGPDLQGVLFDFEGLRFISLGPDGKEGRVIKRERLSTPQRGNRRGERGRREDVTSVQRAGKGCMTSMAAKVGNILKQVDSALGGKGLRTLDSAEKKERARRVEYLPNLGDRKGDEGLACQRGRPCRKERRAPIARAESVEKRKKRGEMKIALSPWRGGCRCPKRRA